MEVYTYQALTLKNENDAARDLAQRFGEYLLQTDSFVSLSLEVDGTVYTCEESCIDAESKLYQCCGRLSEAQEISAKVRTTYGPDLSERLKSGFLSGIKENDLRGELVYRSTDYYNDDETVELCLYDAKGLQFPACDAETTDAVSDISLWYCNTPEIYIDAGGQCENAELHERVSALLEDFLIVCGVEEPEERMSDDWEDCGELCAEGNLWFRPENIPEMLRLLSGIEEALKAFEDVEFRLHMQAIPDGENDYDFAAVKISLGDGGVKLGCCRF